MSTNVLIECFEECGIKKRHHWRKGFKNELWGYCEEGCELEIAIFPLADSFPLFDQFLLSLPFEKATLISWKLEDKALQGMSFRFLAFFTPVRLGDPGVHQASHMACWPICKVGARWHGANPPPIYIDHLGCDTGLNTTLSGCALGLNGEAEMTCQMCTTIKAFPGG